MDWKLIYRLFKVEDISRVRQTLRLLLVLVFTIYSAFISISRMNFINFKHLIISSLTPDGPNLWGIPISGGNLRFASSLHVSLRGILISSLTPGWCFIVIHYTNKICFVSLTTEGGLQTDYSSREY
jgi:hypothetical protein